MLAIGACRICSVYKVQRLIKSPESLSWEDPNTSNSGGQRDGMEALGHSLCICKSSPLCPTQHHSEVRTCTKEVRKYNKIPATIGQRLNHKKLPL